MRLKEKVAIITGASMGIGAETAKLFAKEGAKVVMSARSISLMKDIEAEIKRDGGTAVSMQINVRNRDEVKKMIDDTYDKFGKIDILVNNAGMQLYGYPIDSTDPKSEERYEAMMQTNVRGYWLGAHFAVPYMKRNNGGSIINVSSVRGLSGVPNESVYCMGKGAINMLTRSLAVELAPNKIRINTISPGAIQVELGHWVLQRFGEENHKIYVERFSDVHELGMKLNQPLHQTGRPIDIAYAMVYFASDESKFVTGTNFFVDGGLTAVLPEPPALDMKSLHDYYEKAEELNKWLATLE